MEKFQKGGSPGGQGVNLQCCLTTMFLLKALDKLSNWKLSTENKQAGAFDDLVLGINGFPDKDILLQAKSKEKMGIKVTFKQLMSTNDDFSLPKYFHSYQEIKSKFCIQNVILCTNADLNENAKEYLNKQTVQPDNILYYTKNKSFYKLDNKILPSLKEGIKEYYKKNSNGKIVTVSDEDIEQFVKHFEIHFNYPNGEKLKKIVKRFLQPIKHHNLYCQVSFTELYDKVRTWLELPSGRYPYFTELLAKATFCEIISEKFCETLEKYKVSFNNADCTFDNTKRIYHIVTKENYLLHIIKVYHVLNLNKSKTLYVNPEDNIDVQKQVIESFDLPGYKFLVWAYPNITEEDSVNVSTTLEDTLKNYKDKSLIVIGEEDHKLLQHIDLRDTIYCAIIKESVTIKDLSEDTQEKLLNKTNIVFQGSNVSIKGLLVSQTEDDKLTLCAEVLEKLVKDEQLRIGSRVECLDKSIAPFYISRNFKNSLDEPILEENIYDLNEKVILIVDSAGSGKTTVLTNLAVTIKRNNPHLWVIKIELKDYTEILDDLLERNEKTIDVVELLNFKETTRLKNHFEKLVFSMRKNVVLLVDGVDEISPDYTEIILSMLIECRKTCNFTKIFVTTRPYMTKELEEHLQAHQFTLEPFKKQEQVHFLVSYWNHHLELKTENKKSKCKRYAEVLVNKIYSWLPRRMSYGEGDDGILAMALLGKMVAEIFIDNKTNILHDCVGCEEFLKLPNTKPKFPKKFNLVKLYKMFIERKQFIYMKRENPSGLPGAKQILREKFRDCLTYHRVLAVETILNKNEKQLFPCSPQNDKDMDPFMSKLGLVHKPQHKFHFIHRTFAEYFLAEYLVMELQQFNRKLEFQQFFVNTILSDRFKIFRAFVDNFLQDSLDSIPCDTLQVYKGHVHNKRRFKLSCTLIHKLAKENCLGILQLIFKCVDCQTVRYRKIETNRIKHQLVERSYGLVNVITTIEFILTRAGVNILDTDGKTPLHYATASGNLELVRFLIDEGSNVDITDKRGMTALYNTYDSDVITCLAENDINVNRKDNKGRTALHYAAMASLDLVARKSNVAKHLLCCGADANIKDKNECTPLHLANSMGSLDTVKLLVECGADVKITENKGRTALHLAALSGLVKSVEFLVECGVDVDSKDNDGCTASHLVAPTARLESVNALVECGADVNVQNNDGSTPLHLANSMGSLQTVKLLVECGADVKITENKGRTALHLAALSGLVKSVEFLVECGVDVDSTDNDGCTALHLVTPTARLESVNTLVECGADVNVQNNDGYTALHLAVSALQLENLKVLVESGADVDVEDHDGRTALQIAYQCLIIQ